MRFEPRVADAAVNVTEGGQLGEFGRLVIGFLAAGFALLVTLFLLVDVLVRFVDADLENRLFAGRFPIGEAPAEFGERALAAQALLARLQTHWPDSPYRFELRVADDDEPNALALPGGTVVVTRGLLEAVESENELAFVLGHELGHFHGRDHLRGMGRGVVMAATLAVVGLGTAGDLQQAAALEIDEQQTDARVDQQVAKRIEMVVTAVIRQFQLLRVDDLDEAPGSAAM